MLFSRNGPFVDIYDSCKPLNERYHRGVKSELDLLMKTYNKPTCLHDKAPGITIARSSDLCWRTIGIKHIGKFTIDRMEERYPLLHEILSAPDIISAVISILDPGVGIPKHRDYSAAFMRYHLGYIIPADKTATFIVVGGQKYSWKEGEGVMFDSSYQHYVENNAKERRAVLYVDVLRGNLPEPIRTLNRWLVYAMGNHPIISAINSRDHKQEKISV